MTNIEFIVRFISTNVKKIRRFDELLQLTAYIFKILFNIPDIELFFIPRSLLYPIKSTNDTTSLSLEDSKNFLLHLIRFTFEVFFSYS